MTKVERFWDLQVWQKARRLNQRIYDCILKKDALKDFPYKDQINRSCASVMDNIAEGFGRAGRKEFIQFLSYSKGSIDEVQSQLFRGFDWGYLEKDVFESLFADTEEIASMIVGFTKYLQKSSLRGSKYKVEEEESKYQFNNFSNNTIMQFPPPNLKLKTQNSKLQTK